jgi:hypothetical protein
VARHSSSGPQGHGEELRMDARFRFTRLVRTSNSEIHLIWEEGNRVGQIDLHYAGETVHATLILETDLSVTSEEELLTQIDEDVVSSYLPSFDRTDFLVTVFRGEEISSYTDSGNLETDDEEE